MLRNYLKTALRNLWRNKGYSALNILGLAIGIVCAGLIFLWTEDEKNYDLANEKKNYLYQVMHNQKLDGKIYTFSPITAYLAPAIKEDIPGIKNACRTGWDQPLLFTMGEKSFYERGFYADSSFLSMFTLSFIEGNAVNALRQSQSMIISEKMARKFFGADKNVVGKELKINNEEIYTVSGVVRDLPENTTMRFDWLAPFDAYLKRNEWLKSWGAHGIRTFVELRPDASIASVNQQLDRYILNKDPKGVAMPFLFSMNDWHLRSRFENGQSVGGRIEYVRLFGIVAGIILLMACINFMNLTTACSVKRAKEVGVRKVMGADKTKIITQFLGEAFIISIIAVLFSILIIYLVLPSFNSLVQKQIQPEPGQLLILLLITVACGFLAGSYPALYLSSFNPIKVLKGIKIKAGGINWLKKTLVIVQFSVSVFLIASTIIVYQQIQYVKNRQLGYKKDNLLQVQLRGTALQSIATIRNQLINKGIAQNAASSQWQTLLVHATNPNFSWENKRPGQQVPVSMNNVTADYLATNGMQLISGRDFYREEHRDTNNVIINEAMARIIGASDPVGKRINDGNKQYTVVGLIKDYVFNDMYKSTAPLVLTCNPSQLEYLHIRLEQAGDPEEKLKEIESIMKPYLAGYPFEYRFADDQFNDQFKAETLTSNLSSLFTFLAIVISCLGLFGLAAFNAEQRTKEIGIRKVLGASVNGVIALLSKDFLQLVMVSCFIAIPVSWWVMSKWLQGFSYRTDINWWVFVAAAVAALLIAFITVSVQAMRSAIVNPLKSLRTE
jgi:putative ABC transport system permease protein